MRKKVILIIALAIVVALGAVFAVLNIHAPGELSTWQKSEIDCAWNRLGNMDYGEWYDDGFAWGPRYYGTENGYIFMFVHGMMTVQGRCTVGSYEFRSSQSFNLYAYKDGTFHKVKDLYDQGLISKEAVKAMWDTHQEIEKELKSK